MSEAAARVPRGIPTGGQFAAQSKPESTITLAPVPAPTQRQFAVLSDYEVNYEFGVPQANDLEKVALVADAVANGANTQESIAEALDIHTREGGYYANAAGYLGIVDADKSDGVHAYHLTAIGDALINSEENTRAEMIAQMVERVPEVQVYAEEGKGGLRQAVQGAGFTGTTVGRRVDSIRSWVRTTDDRTGLSLRLAEIGAASKARYAGAAQSAKAQIAAARALRKPEPVYDICNSCFMALPTTGVCDSCA